MTVIIRGLKGEDRELLHAQHRNFFLNGECYAMALAFHQGLGWPIVGLMKDHLIWHAGVRTPDGNIHDVRGPCSEEEFAEPWPMSGPRIIREVTAEELYATRHIGELTIQSARSLAETLWPELPWTTSHAARVQAFAEELEALSRKHGFWVAGSVPAQRPLLFPSHGEEGGYDVLPNLNCTSFTIDRHFE